MVTKYAISFSSQEWAIYLTVLLTTSESNLESYLTAVKHTIINE